MAFIVSLFGFKQDPLLYTALSISYALAIFDSRFISEFVRNMVHPTISKKDEEVV